MDSFLLLELLNSIAGVFPQGDDWNQLQQNINQSRVNSPMLNKLLVGMSLNGLGVRKDMEKALQNGKLTVPCTDVSLFLSSSSSPQQEKKNHQYQYDYFQD